MSHLSMWSISNVEDNLLNLEIVREGKEFKKWHLGSSPIKAWSMREIINSRDLPSVRMEVICLERKKISPLFKYLNCVIYQGIFTHLYLMPVSPVSLLAKIVYFHSPDAPPACQITSSTNNTRSAWSQRGTIHG